MNYFLIKNGQKYGPFSRIEIAEFVQNKRIFLDDLCSSDQGVTWKKIHQTEIMHAISQPVLPEKMQFNKNEVEEEIIDLEMNHNEETITEKVSFFKQYSLISKSAGFSFLLVSSFLVFDHFTPHSKYNPVSFLKAQYKTEKMEAPNVNPERSIASVSTKSKTEFQSGNKAYIVNPEVIGTPDEGKLKIHIPAGKHLFDEEKMKEISTDATVEVLNREDEESHQI